jgi:DNA-directed RNA polymerase subunit RPC12/RpoP
MMGDVLRTECRCGYQSDDLYLGPGMAGPETKRVLGQCSGCHRIVAVLASSKRPRCPVCRRKIVLVKRGDLSGDGLNQTREVASLTCPNYGAKAVELNVVGMLD